MSKKTNKKSTHSVSATPVMVVPSKLDSEKMWDEIKNLKLEMFTLADQFVHLYYKPMIIDPVKLHLTALTKASSALPALEFAISPKYKSEQVDRFIVITLSSPEVKK